MKLNRSKAPNATGNLKFQLPEIEEFKLSNGLKILFVKKNNLPIVNMSLIVNAGSRFDPVNKSGLAYLTSMLVDEGAGGFSALDLDNEIESLGSIFGVSTDSDLIYLNMLSISDKFERSLELLATIYASPLFTNDDFDRERQKLLTSIIRNYDDPSYIATSNFRNLVYNTSPYSRSIIGDTKSVESIINSEVIEYHKNTFTHDNSHLIVVGKISRSELEKLLNKHFDTSTKQIIDEPSLPFLANNKSRVYLINKDGAAQSEIRIGHLTNTRKDQDYYSKIIMNSILGGQFSSRLNLNLREDKGFTYGISSGFHYNKQLGNFQISTSVQSENTGETIKEIVKEIDGIKLSISDEEIEFSKSYQIKRFPAMFETYSQIANNLSSLVHYSLEKKYFDDYIRNIENCSKQEIETVARQRIIADELIYLIVGDRDKILPQLKSATNRVVIELDKFGEKII